MHELRRYAAADGRIPLSDWLASLRDQRARATIYRRLDRLEQGLLGEGKPCRDGVSELKIAAGPGYRIYFDRVGRSTLLLLGGGDKRTQTADIDRAAGYLRDFKRRAA